MRLSSLIQQLSGVFHYVTHAESKHFQSMNVNFGIIKELEGPRIRDKKERYEKLLSELLKIYNLYSSLDI